MKKEIIINRNVITPYLDVFDRETLQSPEVMSLIGRLDSNNSQEYWNYKLDVEWIKRSWNRPEQLLISLFTRFTNWPGDPYAMVQRSKSLV